MEKTDYKKTLRHLYLPGPRPAAVDVPPMNFLMIDGRGDPNTSGEFQGAVEALYGASYGIKMLPRKGMTPEGYFDYAVPPLEGLWNTADGAPFDPGAKDRLAWTLMIMQPAFATAALAGSVLEALARKKDRPMMAKVRFGAFAEGRCVQMLHLGAYDDEPASLARMHAYAAEGGMALDPASHHEIYLNDPRRTSPEKRKTVLRLRIRQG